MEQTPAHEQHNPELLSLMPTDASTVVEIGCSAGALAREYKKLNPSCRYVGVDVVPEYAERARRYCDEALGIDIEDFIAGLGADLWVFGDTLEHLRDPWRVLASIRRVLPASGSVVVCVPNTQHWSVQARLNCGLFRYEDAGLLDRTHLRWFTRVTLLEMLRDAGYRVDAGIPRAVQEPGVPLLGEAIRQMARAIGADPDAAYRDCLPFQYVLRARPLEQDA